MSDSGIRSIGMPRTSIMAIGGRALRSRAAGVWITGRVPRRSVFEDTGSGFFLDRECTREDPNSDDMALWIDAGDGLAAYRDAPTQTS